MTNREIERKFLVIGNEWRNLAKGILYHQGYLNTDPERTVRVRIVENKGFLTIKGISQGASRVEYEYEIPVEHARELLEQLCLFTLKKVRYKISYHGLIWEVDEFLEANKGLVLAEVELPDESYPVETPEWVGEEVTGDPRFYNLYLSQHPYRDWTDEEKIK
ncbi:MAG: CYTH domain-containing protein [Calditrichaeota bacterium]|nr:MAG: CYTH domain-containing protein [Calditrichota bacterium]